jgi:hypothetical protein
MSDDNGAKERQSYGYVQFDSERGEGNGASSISNATPLLWVLMSYLLISQSAQGDGSRGCKCIKNRSRKLELVKVVEFNRGQRASIYLTAA